VTFVFVITSRSSLWIYGIKRPERETSQSPPSSAEIKNMWLFITSSLLHLHGVVIRQ
jgi:hypothetical protein